MRGTCSAICRNPLFLAALALAFLTGVCRADDAETEKMRQRIQELSHRIEELEKQIQDAPADTAPPRGRFVIDEAAVTKIVSDYLKESPGAGMPAGVQTGYFPGQGFVLRSPPNPAYTNWQDECAIPFQMNIRGLLQLGYDYFKVTDSLNHLTGTPVPTPFGDFSQFEVKRARLSFDGTAFSPDVRYCVELDGSSVGLNGLVNVGRPRATPVVTGNSIPGSIAVSVDAVRLYTAYVAYDWRPDCAKCATAENTYSPTLTAIAGKYRPFFGFEQYLGDGNQQFVEYAMAAWYFSDDDDDQQVQAGVQLRACEDRLFATINVSNGNESDTPSLQMDRLPGLNGGFWYDLGGSWNEDRHRWDLYGREVSDLEYHCNPVVRLGTMFDLVWLDRRSVYGVAEQSRVQALPEQPGGGTFVNIFDGGDSFATNDRGFALDAFNEYRAEAFIAGKWRGFSFLNEWWVRDLQDFRATKEAGPGGPVVYSIPATNGTGIGDFLFPKHPVIDFGMVLQAGYFVIPERLEVAARWSWLRGQSGDIYGDGTIQSIVELDGVPVVQFHDAFRKFQEADEYTLGLNYYWKGEMLKWQTDFGVYQGGNPAAGGRRLAGFIPGVDGWLLRTQLQLWF